MVVIQGSTGCIYIPCRDENQCESLSQNINTALGTITAHDQ